jgi:hypothetical protein
MPTRNIDLVSPAIISITSLHDKYPQVDGDSRAFTKMGMISVIDTPKGPAQSLL